MWKFIKFLFRLFIVIAILMTILTIYEVRQLKSYEDDYCVGYDVDYEHYYLPWSGKTGIEVVYHYDYPNSIETYSETRYFYSPYTIRYMNGELTLDHLKQWFDDLMHLDAIKIDLAPSDQ